MRLKTSTLYPGLDDLEKFSFVYEEGDRVVLKENSVRGTIESVTKRNTLIIKLDSGHVIECHESEVEPDAWQPSKRLETDNVTKVESHSLDPYGGDVLARVDGAHKSVEFRPGMKLRDSSGRVFTITKVEENGCIFHDSGACTHDFAVDNLQVVS